LPPLSYSTDNSVLAWYVGSCQNYMKSYIICMHTASSFSGYVPSEPGLTGCLLNFFFSIFRNLCIVSGKSELFVHLHLTLVVTLYSVRKWKAKYRYRSTLQKQTFCEEDSISRYCFAA